VADVNACPDSSSGTPGSETAKLEHGPVFMRSLASIHPAPENELLYRPVTSDDPEIIALAKSISEHGVLDPLVISSDRYIISGHRRYEACRSLGMRFVPCRIVPIKSTEPGFVKLLREHNRQRVKGLEEVFREELVSANPEEAYRALLEHRKAKSRVSADTITIEGQVRRSQISRAKEPLLRTIEKVLEEQEDFWPLTDRRIHYALLNDPPLIHASKPDSVYRNNKHSYKALVELLTRARLAGRIPFLAIHDPTRPVVSWEVYGHHAGFVRKELDGFLKGYYRDLQQSQPNQIEIIGEKNTIDSIIRPVAMEYCIHMTIGRGYCSIPPRYEMAERFNKSGKQRLILLVLSDFDPEGNDIAHSFARSMRDDFGVEKIEPIKVALTETQVQEMQLPPMMKAKEGSSRRKRFVDQHGEDVFELEAVPPERLQAILRDAIDGVLDTSAFNAEVEAEKGDVRHLDQMRRQVLQRIDGMMN
jgi:hypothetical protein